MRKEFKQRMGEHILSFVNRYLKQGTIVQNNWAFYARGEIESLVQEAYVEGREDGRRDTQFDAAINNIIK